MYRLGHFIIIAILFNFCVSAVSSAAWPWGSASLVTINGVSYTDEDFRHWWEHWRDEGSSVPDDMEQFIQWKLLAQESLSMELDQEPGYLRKVDVFSKVRTRMLLKDDTIDSKIEISDEDIKNRYLADYTPIWRLSLLYFNTAEEAAEAYSGIEKKEYTFDDLREKKGPEGESMFKEGNFRPQNFRDNKELRKTLEQFTVGQVSTPQEAGNYFILLRLEEKTMPDESEFSMKHRQIREMLWKEKEAELTAELINGLWDKYEVQVDEELMAQVNKNPGEELLSRPVVMTNRESMPLWMVVKDVRKDFSYRKNKVWTEEEKESLARGFLNGMIAEYLLTWEAQDRKYEEKPPYKWTYEFYKENRLIKELERRLIASQISISDEEIKTYYQGNPDEFRPPDIISVILVEGEEQLLNKIVADVAQGQDFTGAGQKYNLTPIPIIDIPDNQIAWEVSEAVSKLDIGGVSQPFIMYNKSTLAKLVNRKVREPMPLAKVRDTIFTKLHKEKFSRSREEYITMLLEQSDIKVNRGAWKKLKAQLSS